MNTKDRVELTVYVSPEQRDKIKKHATACGLSLSSYIRSILLELIKVK